MAFWTLWLRYYHDVQTFQFSNVVVYSFSKFTYIQLGTSCAVLYLKPSPFVMTSVVIKAEGIKLCLSNVLSLELYDIVVRAQAGNRIHIDMRGLADCIMLHTKGKSV